ncbi:MAG: TonB-dependent receptor [Maricaulis sp.]|nr:TonB-dependent receptor [Maricaulis sp.]
MKNILLTTSVSALAASLVATAGVSAQSLDYSMMSELFGEPVTAGATGAPQRASDVPATMIIITQDDIQRMPEFDIPGILRHYAGVDFNRYSVSDSQVSIRGAATGYSPRLLVLVNGREVYLDSYGYTAWSTLPVQLEEIQQIEVVKGPQSALYGFNAVAGVVNIITRNPDQGNYANMRVNAGNGGYTDAAVSGGYRINDRFTVRGSYGNAESDDFAPFPQNTFAFGLGNEFTRETAAVEGRYQVTDNIHVSAEATYSSVSQQEMVGIYRATQSAYELHSYKVDLEADTDFGFISASVFRNESEILYDFGPLTTELTGFRVQDLFKLGTDDTIRISGEFRTAEANSFPFPGNGSFGYDGFAVSAMWNHKFSNTLDLTLAGRFDVVEWGRDGSPDPTLYPFTQSDYDVTYEEFSYNAALVWRPEFGGTVRFSTGRGIQAPTMFDIGFTVTTTTGLGSVAISGNPTMDASAVTSYEIAYDRAISPEVSLRAAVFHVDTQDVRGNFGNFPDLLPPAASVPTFLFDNRGDTATSGAEFTLYSQPEGPIRWDVSYTYQTVEDDLDAFGLYFIESFEDTTPAHLFNAHVGWTGDRFTADGYLNYVSDITSPLTPNFGTTTTVEVDANMAMSARAGYRINDHFNVSLTAQNLNYGEGNAINVSRLAERRVWLQLSADF